MPRLATAANRAARKLCSDLTDPAHLIKSPPQLTSPMSEPTGYGGFAHRGPKTPDDADRSEAGADGVVEGDRAGVAGDAPAIWFIT